MFSPFIFVTDRTLCRRYNILHCLVFSFDLLFFSLICWRYHTAYKMLYQRVPIIKRLASEIKCPMLRFIFLFYFDLFFDVL
nr:MAG TPA: hypothetical protein [Caudoviricetes sp.]DAP90870.1 MAG TPA: hypothetical protein [Caudoviricetes sp.]DAR00362.1 MAG TPA: hypothetical protein [Caudoviricetes sp.]DAX14248.1 MAG TPA: hypothetical protein [Bacteriophage sp.]DAZ41546.1 MAG TPA: hypothetical protein [Caudoviricetes sp.]